jgi:hypothetical protein
MYSPFGAARGCSSLAGGVASGAVGGSRGNRTNSSGGRLLSEVGAFYDHKSDDDDASGEDGEWDLESATSSNAAGSDVGSQHSEVSFWSAASHTSSLAHSRRSSSNKHSNSRSGSSHTHGGSGGGQHSSTLPTMPHTPPKGHSSSGHGRGAAGDDSDTGEDTEAPPRLDSSHTLTSQRANQQLRRHYPGALGAAVDEASEGNDGKTTADKANCRLS